MAAVLAFPAGAAGLAVDGNPDSAWAADLRGEQDPQLTLDLGKVRGPASDANVTAFRANAAAAMYSRFVVQKLYGGKRPFGYAYGGSGGAYRTIGSIENTKGVWDGVVPYVPGSTMAIPNMFTVRMHAMRILKDKFPQIVDAVEPGGSGDPSTG